ncbi:T9SS type B sorting domain-containing protein [Pontimicrobium sp. IMCC45349]|uniref:T9SS type B sorting domain-containing protein n=1 Tax=Pontimicrobium sp. IMCC45349 TaxID=3391574 RepID=UPI0039A17067
MRHLFLFIFFLISFSSSSQKEAAHWYFGEHAGLNFNSGAPQAITNGEINSSEGCSVISNAQGDLLFYTDGVTVWNSNHSVMPNGEDLLGSESSAQSALIVPHPISTNLYYIFTTDVVQAYLNNGPGNGLNYSIVDMSLDGGFGDVTQKNTLLLSNSSEKITGVKAQDGSGYWIVVHNGINAFYSYKLTAAGLNPPVISTLGPTTTDFNNIRGCLKLSPDGQKLAISYTIYEPEFSGSVYLYDFDIDSGVVSNQVLVATDYVFYGLEFSSNSTKLYASGKVIAFVNGDIDTTKIRVFQYDLSNPNIAGTEYLVHEYEKTYLSDLGGSLQIGLDKRIYHAVPKDKISVIKSPNQLGVACNFNEFDVDLSEKQARYGLPPFVQSYFESIISIENLCFGDNTQFSLDTDEAIVSVEWNFGDPTSGVNNTSLLENPIHTFSQPGSYNITVDVTFVNKPPQTYFEIIEIGEVPNVVSNITLTQCDIDGFDDGITLFNLNEALHQINNGNQNLLISFFESLIDAENNNAALESEEYENTNNNQVIYARVFDNPDCFSITQVTLHVKSASNLGTYITIDVCESGNDISATVDITYVLDLLTPDFPGNDITVFQSEFNALLEINPLQDDVSIPFTQIPELYFRVENNNACDAIGKIGLNILEAPEAQNLTVPFCVDSNDNMLDAGNGFQSYLWSTGETTQTVFIDAPGDYEVTVSNGLECTATFIISSVVTDGVSIEEVVVKDFSIQNSITIIAQLDSNSDYEYSIDGGVNYQSSNSFNYITPGLYNVFVKKDNCTVTSEVVLVGGFPKFFTPNGDSFNDVWRIKEPQFFEHAIINIFDRYGRLLKTTNAFEGWDGTFNDQLMTPNDYWFTIDLGDRIIKGHFSLSL